MQNALPPIQLRESDATLLMQAIHQAVARGRFIRGCENTISTLLHEVERATIVPSDAADRPVATLGSEVVCEDCATGTEFSCRLVAPDKASGSAGQVSILTPLGAALVGRAAGETITHGGPGGMQDIRIVSVRNTA